MSVKEKIWLSEEKEIWSHKKIFARKNICPKKIFGKKKTLEKKIWLKKKLLVKKIFENFLTRKSGTVVVAYTN